jgi:hypothetical protein
MESVMLSCNETAQLDSPALAELGDLQLALVGGGAGDATFG